MKLDWDKIEQEVEENANKSKTERQAENIRTILCIGKDAGWWHGEWYKTVDDKLVCTACISELAYEHLKNNRWRMCTSRMER